MGADVLEFRGAIVDELGMVVYWLSDLNEDEADEILDNHPEWRRAWI